MNQVDGAIGIGGSTGSAVGLDHGRGYRLASDLGQQQSGIGNGQVRWDSVRVWVGFCSMGDSSFSIEEDRSCGCLV